jgi:uncharacterized protein (DUF983 family)
MQAKQLVLVPPKLLFSMMLKCPHCGKSPLLMAGSWINFSAGCKICNYKYEREIGYFSGASWMITYSVASLAAMGSGALMVWKYSELGDLVVAGVPATIGAFVALLFIPMGRSLWMYFDHRFHPLTEDDRLDDRP